MYIKSEGKYRILLFLFSVIISALIIKIPFLAIAIFEENVCVYFRIYSDSSMNSCRVVILNS